MEQSSLNFQSNNISKRFYKRKIFVIPIIIFIGLFLVTSTVYATIYFNGESSENIISSMLTQNNNRIAFANQTGDEVLSIEFTGNITSNRGVINFVGGYFNWLGNGANRITNGWFDSIDSTYINSSQVNSTELYADEVLVNDWLYNQTYSGSTYNETYLGSVNNLTYSTTYNSSYVPYTGATNNLDLSLNNITASYGSKFGNGSQYTTFGTFDLSGAGFGYYNTIKSVSNGAIGNASIIENALVVLGNTESIALGVDYDPTLILTDRNNLEGSKISYNSSLDRMSFIGSTLYRFDGDVNTTTDFCIEGGNCLSSVSGDNSSFNQTLTDSIYSDIKWGYNMTYSGSTYNESYAGSLNNESYLSVYNASYVPYTGATGSVDLGKNKLKVGDDGTYINITTRIFDFSNLIPDLTVEVPEFLAYTSNVSSIGKTDLRSALFGRSIGLSSEINGADNPDITFFLTDDSVTPNLVTGIKTFDFDIETDRYRFDDEVYVNGIVNATGDICTIDGNCLSDIGGGSGDFSFSDFQDSFNSNWTALDYDKWMYNQTISAYNLYNDVWSSTYNETYLGSINNASYLSTYNETYLGSINNLTYSTTYNASYDMWAYNQTTATYTLYNDAWSSTYNATYDALSGLSNSPWVYTATTIYNTTIKLGIGTNNPSHSLTIQNVASALNVSGKLYTNETGVSIGHNNIKYDLDVKGNFVASQYGGLISSSNNGTLVNSGSILNYFADPFKIGTRYEDRLDLITNNAERLSILGSGYVGIGTSSPASPLEVSVTGAGNMFILDREGTNTATFNLANYGLNIESLNNISFKAGIATNSLFIEKNTGYIGIGTGTPKQELNVVGDLNVTGSIILGNSKIYYDYDASALVEELN